MIENKELQKQYHNEIEKQTHKMLIICSVVMLVLEPLFCIVDYLYEYNNLKLFINIRIMDIFFLLSILFLLKTTFGKHKVNILGVLTFFVIGGSIASMVFFAEKHKLAYYEGTALVLLAVGLFMPWKTKYTVITCCTIYFSYFIPHAIFSSTWDAKTIFVYNFYMLSVISLITTANYVINKIRFNSFKFQYELQQTKDALWGELKTARKIQTVLLPENPVIAGYEILAYTEPALEVGGDYYDVINVHDTDWIIIGDVSGHGVPAGLIMVMAQTALHTTLQQFPDIAPASLLQKINYTILQNIKQLGGEKYMTITVFKHEKDGHFSFSGLHLDILIYRSRQNKLEVVPTDGIWLGLMNNIEGKLNNYALSLDIGDVMLLHTDGITESLRKDYQEGLHNTCLYLFGQDRLENIFINFASQPLHAIKASILAALQEYTCRDDVTFMLLKRTV